VKEVARHLLRRPVVGIAGVCRTADGRWILVRRTDTGKWALPGGTLEWGETLRSAITREVFEETGARVLELGDVVGVYSAPERDPRFHAVTIVVAVAVDEPQTAGVNPLEIGAVRLFHESELPADTETSHGMADVIRNARAKGCVWE